MKKILLSIFALLQGSLCGFIVANCQIVSDNTTTNIYTWGYVKNEEDSNLEGIRIIVHSHDADVSDTVYTQSDGVFASSISGIAYPVISMEVTAIDPDGIYESQTITTTYTYECGVEHDPETDTAINTEDILFVLKKMNTIEALNDVIGYSHSPTKVFINGQLHIKREGTTFTVTGQEVR